MSYGSHERRPVNIVNGTEVAPDATDAGYNKFLARRDRALATIVLSVDP